MFGDPDPVPGAKYAFANGNEETSLVSLIFPNWEGKGLSVTDRITGVPIPFRFVVWDGMTIVTLELIHGRLSKPHLAFGGSANFTALLKPKHSLSTFDGLSFSDRTVFLQDHGVEKELRVGVTTAFSQKELAWLWLGDKLSLAARVHVVSIGDAGGIKLLAPPGCLALVKQKNQLHDSTLIGLGDHLVVAAPANDAGKISLSLTH